MAVYVDDMTVKSMQDVERGGDLRKTSKSFEHTT